MADLVKLVTYNIHSAVGVDGRHDIGRIATVLAEVGADVVGLQEVDSRGLPVGAPHPRTVLADALGMHEVPGVTMRERGGDYGNAILSRWPLGAVRRHDLSVPGREPRGAVDVEVRGPGPRPLRVVVTHLGLRRGERLRQVVHLLRVLADRHAGTVALLGDFNEGSGLIRSLRELTRWFGATPRVRSFPSRLPLLSLDRIWVRPQAALRELGVHASPAARAASDHLPVWGVVDVGQGGRHIGPPAPPRTSVSGVEGGDLEVEDIMASDR